MIWMKSLRALLAAALLAAGPVPALANPPVPAPATAPAAGPAAVSAPGPLLRAGQPVDWWFAYKFNALGPFRSRLDPQLTCLFGGKVRAGDKAADRASLRYIYAWKGHEALEDGGDFLGETLNDPLGATFGQAYLGDLHYVIWNDDFSKHPKIPLTGAHSKGMLAWNDAGEGFILQVTTPSWPGAGRAAFPRADGFGNTLGCVKQPNNIKYAQHFFALKLTHADVAAMLKALIDVRVVTYASGPKPAWARPISSPPSAAGGAQIVNNGGPADIVALVKLLGWPPERPQVMVIALSSGVRVVAKPETVHAPPWQVVSSALGGLPIKTATWRGDGEFGSTLAADPRLLGPGGCWDAAALPEAPGAVQIINKGHWLTTDIGLQQNANHAKLGVSLDAARPWVIFGDMNQDGAVWDDPHNANDPKCDSAQNGRGGLFFVLDSRPLWLGLTALLDGPAV